MMNLYVDELLSLELINAVHAPATFDMVDKNRLYLRTWLPFVDQMETVGFAERFTQETMQRNLDGSEFAFVIMEQQCVIGRVGVYKIDKRNKIGEVGYWLI